jgi:hypothetical protein
MPCAYCHHNPEEEQAQQETSSRSWQNLILECLCDADLNRGPILCSTVCWLCCPFYDAETQRLYCKASPSDEFGTAMIN